MQFWSFSWRKNPKFFPVRPFFGSCVFDEYQSALIPRKIPCPSKVLVMRLYYNDLSAEEHFKKIMKMLFVSIFNFIILNLVEKGILDPSWY